MDTRKDELLKKTTNSSEGKKTGLTDKQKESDYYWCSSRSHSVRQYMGDTNYLNISKTMELLKEKLKKY